MKWPSAWRWGRSAPRSPASFYLRPQTRRRGSIIGLAGAVAASRLLKSFVFGVSTLDPLVLVVCSVLVLLLAMAASLLPARRAASIDPMKALRANSREPGRLCKWHRSTIIQPAETVSSSPRG